MDKRANPRSRQFVFPPPSVKKPRVEEMSLLPAEIYLEILKNLPASDLKSARLVSKKFNSIIKNNGRKMDRSEYSIKIRGTKEGIVIDHNMKKRIVTESEDFASFDFEKWNFVDVVSLEFNNLKSSLAVLEALETLCDALVYFRQSHIRSLRFQTVELDQDFKNVLQELFSMTIPTCQELFFRDSSIPASFAIEQIEDSKLEHFRWMDCPNNTINDHVLKKFAYEMKTKIIKNNYFAEVNSISHNLACEFIEAWVNCSAPSHFNLIIQGCDEAWKLKFLMECEHRKLTQFCMEFQSKSHLNSHIKVTFSEETNTCRIWPIFDMPARCSGIIRCSARYFRDF